MIHSSYLTDAGLMRSCSAGNKNDLVVKRGRLASDIYHKLKSGHVAYLIFIALDSQRNGKSNCHHAAVSRVSVIIWKEVI